MGEVVGEGGIGISVRSRDSRPSWNLISRYLVDGKDGTTQHNELRLRCFHRFRSERKYLLEW